MEKQLEKIKQLRYEILKSFFLLFIPHIFIFAIFTNDSKDSIDFILFHVSWFLTYFLIALILYISASYIIRKREIKKLGGELNKEEEKAVKELSPKDKAVILFNSSEMTNALTLCYVLMKDIGAEKFIEYEYFIGKEKFKIIISEYGYYHTMQGDIKKDSDQHAIDFNEWTSNNNYILSSDGLWHYMSDGNPDNGITSEQLLKKYKQNNNEGA